MRRLAWLLGLFLALLIVVHFMYPPGAYPLENLALGGVLLAGALVLTARLFAGGGTPRAALLAALGAPALLASQAFVLWAVARWSFVRVPAAGREWVLGLVWQGVATGAGLAAALFLRVQLKQRVAFAVLRRLLALAALGFGLYALYQYFIGYPQSLAVMRAQTHGPVSDLMTQGMLHALSERRVAGRLGNPNIFAAQLVILAVFCASLLRRGEGRAWRAVGVAGLMGALAGILLSRSRGGLLTFLVAGLGAGWMLFQDWRAARRAAPQTIRTALAWIGFGWLALGTARLAQAAAEGAWVRHFKDIATIRERLFYWEIACKVWARHPWIGEGPGGFTLLYLTLKSPLARESQYAHSWFFQVGAELGLVGLALLLAFWGGVGWIFWRARRRPADPENHLARAEAPWFMLALAVLIFNGLFEFTLQWRPFLVLAGLLAGVVVALCVEPAPGGEIKGARRAAGWAGLVMAAALFLAALLMSPPYHLAVYDRWQAEGAAEEGDWARAAALYARAARWLPDEPDYLIGKAVVLEKSGAAGQAWPLLARAAELNPYSASTLAAEADWLYDQGRQEEAIKRLGEAIERYPTHVGYRLQRARWLLEAGRPELARADLVFIEKNELPVWEYQRSPYNESRQKAGLAPIVYPPDPPL